MDIFISHVDHEGLFLKVFGQTNRHSGTFVERYIAQMEEHFARNDVNPIALKVGQLLLARFSDGRYYRARIESLQALGKGYVSVKFVDYGNVGNVTISNLKTIDSPIFEPILKLDDQASEFCIAGIMARTGSSDWNDDILSIIKDLILYADLKCNVLFQLAHRRLARFYFNGEDLATFLIQKGIGVAVTEQAQQTVMQTCVDPPRVNLPPVYSVPPPVQVATNFPSFNMNRMLMPQIGLANISPVNSLTPVSPSLPTHVTTVRAFKPITLECYTEHKVYISFIENGPAAFAVQLQKNELLLDSLMVELNKIPVNLLSVPAIPGTVCLGRYSDDQKLCRAVITTPKGDRCQVYYVDFGNNEEIPSADIFDIPEQYLKVPTLAMRFCLAGVSDLGTITEEMKTKFMDIVNDKLLLLQVVPPEGPLMQYGELYYNGQNIKDLLKPAVGSINKFIPMPLPEINSSFAVSVSFVNDMCSFYVQRVEYSESLNSVMEAVKEHCDKASCLNIESLHFGMPCCALFKEDEQWYRAEILSVSRSGVEVFYVDYGNIDTVQAPELKPCSKDLIVGLETQALHCSLKGFENCTDTALVTRFEEYVLEKELKIVIRGHLEDVLQVELFDITVDPPVNISSQLTRPQSVVNESFVPEHGAPVQDTEWVEGTSESAVVENSYDKKKFGGKERSFGSGRFFHSDDKSWNKHDDNEEGRKPWRKREDDDGRQPWRKRDEDNEDGKKPWRRHDDNEDGRRPWRKREDSDDGDKKPWLRKRENEDSNETGFRRRNDSNRSEGREWEDRSSFRRRDNDANERKWGNKRDDKWKNDDDGGSDKWNNNRGDRQGREDRWGARNDNEDGDGFSRRRRDFRNDREDSKFSGDNFGSKKRWNDDTNDGETGKWNRGGNRDGFSNRRTSSRDENNDFQRGGHGRFGNREDGDKKPWKKREGFDGGNGNGWRNNAEASVTVVNDGGDNWDDNAAVPVQQTGLSLPVLTLGSKELVDVVYINSPSDFYVQMKSNSDILTTLMNDVTTYAEGGSAPVASVNTGMLCVARYAEDETWYRASVVTLTADVASVKFVDYGNQDDVQLSSILEISAELTAVPVQAVSCSLLGAKAAAFDWSDEEINTFSSLTEEKNIEAHFVSKNGDKYEVILRDVDTDEIVNKSLGCTSDDIETALVPKPVSFLAPASSVPEFATAEDRLLEKVFEKDTVEQVSLSWFVNPEEFYCQLLSQQNSLVTMMNDIQTFYCGRSPLTGNISEGCPVIARFKSDRVLYRAEVKEAKGFQYVVQFVDFGNCDLINKTDLYEMEKRFLNLPKFAVLCALNGVSPVGGDWEAHRIEIDDIYSPARFECIFQDQVDGKKYLVTLKNNDVNIADELVSKGLAQLHSRVSEEIQGIQYDLLAGQTFLALITYIDGVDQFFIQLNPNWPSLIQDKVKQYLKSSQAPLPPDQIQNDMLCISTPDSQEWYRARVVDCAGTVGIFVSFIDFGDGEEVPKEKILPIPEELCKYQAQAVECYLTRDEIEITDEFQDQFKESLEGQSVFVHVDTVIDNKLSVSLFDTAGKKFDLLCHFGNSSILEVDPICPMLITGAVSVYVSYVDCPANVWVQMAKDSDTISKLLDDMFAFYETDAKGKEADATTTKYYAVKSSNDDNWYRATVESRSEELQATFIDYGNTESVLNENALLLDESFYIHSALAMKVVLPFETKVESEVFCNTFNELTTEKELITSFVRIGEILYCDLISEGKSICKELEKLNIGSVIPDFPFIQETLSKEESDSSSVFVSFIESPSSFWVQMAEDAALIEELQQDLQTTAADFQTVQSLSEAGHVFTAQYTDDGNWYRAKCIAENENEVSVCFIDYGNTDVVDVSAGSIKILPERLQDIPGYAVRYNLDLLPLDISGWTEKALERFEGLVAEVEGPLTAKVLSSGENVFVNIYAGDKEISQILIDEGLAIPGGHLTEVSVQSDVKTLNLNVKNVFVSYGKSPSDFWIQVESVNEQHDKMLETLADAANFSIVDDVVIGSVVVAQHSEDDQWYRAKVLSCDNTTFEVLFIDYGNIATVTELRTLPVELADIHPLAVNCTLILPSGLDKWPDEVNDKFVELITDENAVFEMEALDDKEPMCISLLHNGKKVEEILCGFCSMQSNTLKIVDNVDQGGNIPSSTQTGLNLFNATVSHVKSPEEFWIQKSKLSAKLLEVTHQLTQWESFPPVSTVSEGDICAALFPDDQTWYRAKILAQVDGGTSVLYIDYGNSSVASELRTLPKEIADIPPLAKYCALQLPGNLSAWPDVAVEKFDELVGPCEEEFQVEVLEDGEPCIVNLAQNGKDIVSQLIDYNDVDVKDHSTKEIESDNVGISEIENIVSHNASDGQVTDSVLNASDHDVPYNIDASETIESNIGSCTNESQEIDKAIIDTGDNFEKEEYSNNTSEPVFMENELLNGNACSDTEDLVDKPDNMPEPDIGVKETTEDLANTDITEEKNGTLDNKMFEVLDTDNSLLQQEVVRNVSDAVDESNLIVPEKKVADSVSSVELRSFSNPSTPKLSRSEKIVPGSISRGLSQEEIYSALSEPPTPIPKVPHSEKIVSGCIASCNLQTNLDDVEEKHNGLAFNDATEDNTTVVTRSAKICHSDKIVAGCVSQEYQ